MLLGVDEVILFFLGVAIFLAVIELGYRLGLGHRDASDDAGRTHITALQSALLGLLALLLGFTFAMAVSRFETRKTLVLEESNAIGKAYWRSQLIAPARRGELAKLLKDYVATRLEFHLAAADQARLDAANMASARIEQQLWAAASRQLPAVPGCHRGIELHCVRDRAERQASDGLDRYFRDADRYGSDLHCRYRQAAERAHRGQSGEHDPA